MVFSEEVGGVKFGHKGTLCPGDQDRTTSWLLKQNWCIKGFHNQSSLLKVNHLYLGWCTCWFVRLLVAHLDTTFFCLKEKNIEGQDNSPLKGKTFLSCASPGKMPNRTFSERISLLSSFPTQPMYEQSSGLACKDYQLNSYENDMISLYHLSS